MKQTTRQSLENAGIADYTSGTAQALATVRELNAEQHLLDASDIAHGCRMVSIRLDTTALKQAIADLKATNALAIVASIPVA